MDIYAPGVYGYAMDTKTQPAPVSPWVRRALEKRLPAKDYTKR
jgi:hypothetical protein